MSQYTPSVHTDDRTHLEHEDDNSSDEDRATDMEAREARAMAAQLENMKQIERAQKSQSISQTSPRGLANIGINQGGMSGPHFPASPIPLITQPVMKTQTSHHQRTNSNPRIPLQPRLSNSSLHSHGSGSRTSPYNSQMQTFHPVTQQPVYATTPNSYQMQHASSNPNQQRAFFSAHPANSTGARRSDPALTLPSLDETKDSLNDNDNNDTLKQIWKEIKEIKVKLTDEQEKNDQLRDENRRLREAVRHRNRTIKQLSNEDDNQSSYILGTGATNGTNEYDNQSEPLMNINNNNNNTNGGPTYAPYAQNRTGSRNSITSIGSEDTLPPENKSIGDWMSGLGNSLKPKKCNWF